MKYKPSKFREVYAEIAHTFAGVAFYILGIPSTIIDKYNSRKAHKELEKHKASELEKKCRSIEWD